MLASVAVPVTNNLANIQTSYTAKAVTSQQQNFLNVAVPNAEAASAKYGTYTSVMLAQSILESGWGASTLATQANNLFGMKGSYNGQTYYANTSEWSSGTGYYNINAGFRKYPSWAASFEDNGYKLRTGTSDKPSRYNMTWIENASDYSVATQGLKDGGYATSPTYPQSLNNVISTYGLTQYDPSVENVTKTMRVLSSGNVYSGPADSSVVSVTGSLTAGQVVTVDKIITYKDGTSYMHINSGWINGSMLTASSTQSPTGEKAGTTSNAGNPAVKVTYTSAIAEWKNPGSGVVGYLQVGASQSVVGKAQVNGKWWYKLSSGNWVPGEYVYVTGLSQIPTISATNESITINVNNQSTNVKIKYISGYSIAVWSTPGANPTGKYLKDGTTVQTVGYTTVNGKKWYKLSDNEWIPAEYTEEANTSSSSNEAGSVIVNYISGYSIAVWSTPGANPTGKYIADGTSVKYYATTSYKGQTWYKIGENQWIPGQYVKASNTSGSLTVTYTAGYSIAVWSNPGSGVTGKYLKNGTTVKYFDAKNYNGQTWYKIGENQWVPAQYVSVN